MYIEYYSNKTNIDKNIHKIIFNDDYNLKVIKNGMIISSFENPNSYTTLIVEFKKNIFGKETVIDIHIEQSHDIHNYRTFKEIFCRVYNYIL